MGPKGGVLPHGSASNASVKEGLGGCNSTSGARTSEVQPGVMLAIIDELGRMEKGLFSGGSVFRQGAE